VRFPEDHHTSTVEGAAAWERARGEADDAWPDDSPAYDEHDPRAPHGFPYGLDEAGWERYCDAADEVASMDEEG
jgi:hypothetical protein